MQNGARVSPVEATLMCNTTTTMQTCTCNSLCLSVQLYWDPFRCRWDIGVFCCFISSNKMLLATIVLKQSVHSLKKIYIYIQIASSIVDILQSNRWIKCWHCRFLQSRDYVVSLRFRFMLWQRCASSPVGFRHRERKRSCFALKYLVLSSEKRLEIKYPQTKFTSRH